MIGRRLIIASGLGIAGGTALAGNAKVTPYPIAGRAVGIAYSLWHQSVAWESGPEAHRPWGTPSIGYYRSDDTHVLAQHASCLADAGVDFTYLDWSNDLGTDIRRQGGPKTQRFIENASLTLFETWSKMPQAPRVAIMIGTVGDPHATDDGKLRGKADEVHALLMADPERAKLLYRYFGKPLLIVYVNTPSPWQDGLPPWSDERFTVRFMTGFLSQQPALLGPDRISKYGYWSWEDRSIPTYSIYGGHPECMTVVAAWRGAGSPGRDNGKTYIGEWEYARRTGPRIVLAGTFNEWWRSEQINSQSSKDIEPSALLGTRYLDILREQATLFKAGAA